MGLGTITAVASNPYGVDDPNRIRGAVSYYVPAYYPRGLFTQKHCTRIILGRSARQNPILGFTNRVLYDSLWMLCRLDSNFMEVSATYR